MIAEWLSDRKGKKVAFVVPQRGRKKRLIALVQQNAELALGEIEHTDAAAFQQVLEDLKQQFKLKQSPRRIECFDISNIQGTMAVGSMVVCENGLMQPKDYKRFRIKTVEGSDDFGMIEEVITRRYSRLLQEDTPFPDLIMVDGGKGQLHAATYALYKLGVKSHDVIGLAKARGVRGSETDQERVFTTTSGDGIVLDTSTKNAQLLQHIRDEAHRFAITYHRTLRKKANLHSILEEIPGVGQKRRKRLLTHFGSLKKLKEATIEEIATTPSVNHELAETIYTFLHTYDQEKQYGS
jgi:excinuclease ABC subunit C